MECRNSIENKYGTLILLAFLSATLPLSSATIRAEEPVAPNAEQSVAEQEEEELQSVSLADGNLTLQLPAGWKQVDPRSRIVELEFSIPPAEGQELPGRLTMMQSGGGVKANIDRWKGQFIADRDAGANRTEEVKKLEIDGLSVHVVDLSGTFLDRPGPFAPATRRDDYRMLGAILETKQAGDYYLKFYAPAATVAAHAEAFHRMIESIQWSGKE